MDLPLQDASANLFHTGIAERSTYFDSSHPTLVVNGETCSLVATPCARALAQAV